MDEDDRPGYLIDYVKDWANKNGIHNLNDFNESFQSDSFEDKLNVFAEEVLRTAGIIE